MTTEEAKTLKHFSVEEIESTGADLFDVQLITMQKADTLRELLGRPIHLLSGGLTTGNHKSPEHAQGLAIDCYLDAPVDPYYMFKRALDAGFNRIGVYWNGTAYSFHLATGKAHGFWTATKPHKGALWKYGTINVDPSTMK